MDVRALVFQYLIRGSHLDRLNGPMFAAAMEQRDRDLEDYLGDLHARVHVLENGSVDVTIDDLTVTVAVAHGAANTAGRIEWGDGPPDNFTLDGWGAVTLAHTYSAPGTYHVTVTQQGEVMRENDVTVPPGGP